MSFLVQPQELFHHRSRCWGCFEKQRKIDSLQAENVRLRQELAQTKKKKEKIMREGVFGSSTPSSKQPKKENSDGENKGKKGGGKKGHRGHGRKGMEEDEFDRVVEIKMPETCPDCNTPLVVHDDRERAVVDAVRLEVEKVLYRYTRGLCPKCHKKHSPQVHSVLPQFLYGNELLSQVAVMHYVHGVSLGKILEMLGPSVKLSGILGALYRLSHFFEPVVSQLISDYRNTKVRHADESPWRTDGHSGYVWIFCARAICIYEFQDTRSARVVTKILGDKPLSGALVVDRYAGYNKAPCDLQYCFSHILRDVEDLAEEFDGNPAVDDFTRKLIPFVATSQGLRGLPISDKEYYQRARDIKEQIQSLMTVPYDHLGVTGMQQLFIDKEERLFRWIVDRDIPCENNFAERQARIPVLARKVSFGSQSELGAKMRGRWMTTLHTARLRLSSKEEIQPWLKNSLDEVAKNPKIELYPLLPPIP